MGFAKPGAPTHETGWQVRKSFRHRKESVQTFKFAYVPLSPRSWSLAEHESNIRQRGVRNATHWPERIDLGLFIGEINSADEGLTMEVVSRGVGCIRRENRGLAIDARRWLCGRPPARSPRSWRSLPPPANRHEPQSRVSILPSACFMAKGE